MACISPTAGEIIVRGEKADIHGPNDAIARGIGMVHQHFMLVPVMTVTENVMLGVEEKRNGVFLDHAKVAARIREISQLYGLEVDPDAYIKDLPVGIQQRVEIIKVLYRQADILILDEPTAVLTPQEVDGLVQGLALAGGKRQIHHLYHPQIERSDGAGRPHHRSAERADRWHRDTRAMSIPKNWHP